MGGVVWVWVEQGERMEEERTRLDGSAAEPTTARTADAALSVIIPTIEKDRVLYSVIYA